MHLDIEQLPPDLQRQAVQKLQGASPKEPKRLKYGNKKTTVGDLTFDSKKEAQRYAALLQAQQAGTISDLRLQPEYTLQEAFKKPDGEKVPAIRYRADFAYLMGSETVIEDVKSDATRKNPVYRMKRKMMAKKGYTVKEI